MIIRFKSYRSVHECKEIFKVQKKLLGGLKEIFDFIEQSSRVTTDVSTGDDNLKIKNSIVQEMKSYKITQNYIG